jgi:hypothetical protein
MTALGDDLPVSGLIVRSAAGGPTEERYAKSSWRLTKRPSNTSKLTYTAARLRARYRTRARGTNDTGTRWLTNGCVF